MEVSKKTIEVLKNAGWYEGRKIDITENIEFLKEKGFEILESGKRFMEEFGELNINVEEVLHGTTYISKHTTCIKRVVGILDSSRFGLKKYVKEKVMLIGALGGFEINLYISESGRIFMSVGWAGDSIWEAWDNIINEKGMIPWSKFKE